MTHGITQEIEKQAKAAGSLAQNDHYVDNSVSGTTLANNQIPSQYTKAVQSSGTIKYVLMDGGGNDCLQANNPTQALTGADKLFTQLIGRFDEAISAYNRALAGEQSTDAWEVVTDEKAGVATVRHAQAALHATFLEDARRAVHDGDRAGGAVARAAPTLGAVDVRSADQETLGRSRRPPLMRLTSGFCLRHACPLKLQPSLAEQSRDARPSQREEQRQAQTVDHYRFAESDREHADAVERQPGTGQ